MKKRYYIIVFFITIFSLTAIIFASYPVDEESSRTLQNKTIANFINATNQEKEEEKILYSGEIEHLFTHCLLAYPDLAFDRNNNMRNSYMEDCITPNEFLSVLENLYENNYALIDINKIYKEENGKIVKAELYLPKGKKPLIFSFDDVVYDQKKMHKGMVDKIIIDNKREIATSTIIRNRQEIKYDNEFITIIETFVKNHPDFSVDGAKGTICLTGFDGILGYRTGIKNKINREEEIIEAKKVVDVLKEKGWNFACHSYGHYHMKKISLEKFKDEIKLWNEEVVPLIGSTEIYVYPYGEWEVYDDEYYLTEKHKLLLENGFKLFCGVGIRNFYGYIPFKNIDCPKTLFMDRKAIDGYTLTNRKEELFYLFNTDSILESKYRLT